MFCAAPPMHVCEFSIPCPCLSITPALPLSQLKSTQRLPPPFLDMDCRAVLERNDKTKPSDDTQIRRLLSWFHQTALKCSLSPLSTSCRPYITSPYTSACLFRHNRCLFLLLPWDIEVTRWGFLSFSFYTHFALSAFRGKDILGLLKTNSATFPSDFPPHLSRTRPCSIGSPPPTLGLCLILRNILFGVLDNCEVPS